MNQFDYVATGPRMGLLVPSGLESVGLLDSLHIDAWVRPGQCERIAEGLFGPRARNRVIREIPSKKITAHPTLFAVNRIARRQELAGRDTSAINQAKARVLRGIARQCKSPAVFGMQSCSVELFDGRKLKVLEQFAEPEPIQRRVLRHELERFCGWMDATASTPTRDDDRNRLELRQADIVWAPSEHVISSCIEDGGDRAKFRLLSYPMPSVAGMVRHRFSDKGRLRVVFAGTLTLQKGVQYIYEALRGWWPERVEMHFFGPNQLTARGTACLAEVGTVHGPIPRAELLREFSRSDILLFPSLSEGSALVTGEAAAMGLPVVATRESGPPQSATIVPARDPDAIREAIERILDHRSVLYEASRRCLSEAAKRTPQKFKAEIGALAHAALRECA